MRPSLRERLRYAFDNFMSRGTVALVVGLFVISVLIVLVVAVIATVFGASGDQNLGFFTLLWRNLLRTLDPGTMGGDEGTPFFLALMLAVTIGGIFIIASLIGVLITGLESKLSELRKGRSRVLEHDHTVILGWSQQIFTVLQELVEANANRPRAVVVVLADRDKVEMEDEIRARLPSPKSTRVICRHGRPTDVDDIDIANVQTSRAIIVLSPESDDPDADVLKTVLAILNDANRRPEPYHVVAMFRGARNAEVARLIGKGELELIVIEDFIARITAQACRQSGLSIVYSELLDFTGNEIYLTSEPSLVGRSFADALIAYEDCALIGVHNNGARLNPPMETAINTDDRLIVIASDDDAIRVSGVTPSIRTDAVRAAADTPNQPERTLVLGWNRRAPSMLSELDRYVPTGSSVTVVASNAVELELSNSELTITRGDPCERPLLDALGIDAFDHVIVLTDDDVDPQQADARTLMTLVHVRDIASRDAGGFTLTTEIRDPRNRTLAEISEADDFIVSDRLASLLITQIAENKALGELFDRLLEAHGSEFYMKPVSDYVAAGQPVSFYTLVEAARRRGEVAVGYRVAALADRSDRAYGVVINPNKGAEIAFTQADRVIVLAER